MTPSLARLILQRQRSLNFPLKWFSIPQCFRYERMTRGRKREHYQWNLDVVGQPELVGDAEVISALLTSLEKMGLNAGHIELRLNDRKILNGLLRHLGVPEPLHDPVMVVIDKREKISPDDMAGLLGEQGLDPTQIGKLNDFFDSSLEGLTAARKHLGQEEAATHDLETLAELLRRVGLGDYVTLDCSVVRGLSYYTGAVFEVRDRAGKFRAICGGGRYDKLLSMLGGDAIPAIGFGFGDVVILEMLAELGLLPTLTQEMDFAVIPYSQDQSMAAMEVGNSLRKAGFRAHVDYAYRKLGRALQKADEMGARHAVLLLPDELSRGEIKIRDMARRSERIMPLEEFLANPSPLHQP